MLTPMMFALALATSGLSGLAVRFAALIISMSSVKRRLQTSQSPIEMAVFCSLRISCMIHSGQTVNRTRESKHPYLTPTGFPEEFF